MIRRIDFPYSPSGSVSNHQRSALCCGYDRFSLETSENLIVTGVQKLIAGVITFALQNGVTVTPQVNQVNVQSGAGLPTQKDVYKKEQFSPSNGATTVTVTSIPRSNSETVFLNGVLQQQGVSYTITNNVFTFATAFSTGDKVEINYVVA